MLGLSELDKQNLYITKEASDLTTNNQRRNNVSMFLILINGIKKTPLTMKELTNACE